MTKNSPIVSTDEPASELIDARIQSLADWRGDLLASLRSLIRAAHATIVEEWKWSTPAWYSDGLICTGETYKQVVKLTFAKGASLPDPARLFNSSLDGKVRRAIDFREGAEVNQLALTQLIQAAVELNKRSAR
ncbi:hypothetical protein B0G76_3160 [Paraburkholderia sp. BL23I1N1]|uniref:DUF1801 domain-containing protein n=1 Tax=Paraburkholderia sp. BL23I1N1 TaxID=1938802 RepID=UPI000FEFC823|nr:DUF1801 domain-containing protein [Paraburkholderia sp. BL23I1N1]RKE36940.1 hypothetical protein B0G76_3160 [Paraburkholderia sp. BL23I1N1]